MGEMTDWNAGEMTNWNAGLSLWRPVFNPRPGHVMCGGQSDIGTFFTTVLQLSPSQYHSAEAPYSIHSFIHSFIHYQCYTILTTDSVINTKMNFSILPQCLLRHLIRQHMYICSSKSKVSYFFIYIK